MDRSRTPWLLVAEHIPLYTTMSDEMMAESGRMRVNVESLLYAAKADIVFAGHVHAYERTESVYKEKLRCDGPVFITIGDGGNHEGPSCWATEVPEWSALRESSFGFGILDIQNETHALWTWHRTEGANVTIADRSFIHPASTRCGQELLVISA